MKMKSERKSKGLVQVTSIVDVGSHTFPKTIRKAAQNWIFLYPEGANAIDLSGS